MTQHLLRHGARDEILERMRLEGDISPNGWPHTRSRSDRGILRQAKPNGLEGSCT